MRSPDYLLLSVHSPRESAKLYTTILGCSPVEDAESFVLYALPGGLKIGLWAAHEVAPTPRAPGGVEISFSEKSRENVLATCEAWRALGLRIVQEPCDMDFGFTFVAEDPDGHRLRPFVLAINPR
jgi:catechol 2,3-dioxygenase-like lactoylglutathione lyase family enzyme